MRPRVDAYDINYYNKEYDLYQSKVESQPVAPVIDLWSPYEGTIQDFEK